MDRFLSLLCSEIEDNNEKESDDRLTLDGGGRSSLDQEIGEKKERERESER